MFEGEEIAFSGLEICNYRHLQTVAKKMGLPSNVKKVHLIEMIRAKKYCSEADLKEIVDRVKMERKANAQAKKKIQKKKLFRLQGTEVSSTSNSKSPPISLTPKCSSDFVIQFSPDISQTIMKYQPRPNILRTGSSILQPLKRGNESDRVLRSFNSLKRPNYRIMEQNNCVIGVVNAQNTLQERVHEIRERYQSVNVTIQRQRPAVDAVVQNSDRQLVPLSRSANAGPKPIKRQRKVSGIYPIQPREKPYYEYIPTVGFRQTDGRVAKINAVVQKPLASTLLPKNHTFVQKNSLIRRNVQKVQQRPTVVTVQDVINYHVDNPSIDVPAPRAIATNRPYEIDQPNAIDRQMYQSNALNQIAPEQREERSIDYESRMYDNRTQTDANSIKLSYQGKTLVNIVPEQGLLERDPNQARKVYKNRQVQPDDFGNGWNPNNDVNGDWGIYNLNDQCVNERTSYKHTNDQPVSTNYKVKQGRITAPLVREQRYSLGLTERNIEHARNMDYARNACYTENARTDGMVENFEADRSDVCIYQRTTNRPIDVRNTDVFRTTDYARSQDPRTQYPNMSSLTDIVPNEDYSQDPVSESNYSVYYHKKIRADQVRAKGERLPRINDAFSQFNDVQYKKLSQPLYVKVCEESERVPMLMHTNNANNTCMLESIYNFKNQFVTNPPVLRIATTQTQCTFSTKTVPTAFAQAAAGEFSNKSDPYERVNAYQPCEGFYDYPKQKEMRADFGCDEVLSSSTASLDTPTSQELGATVTIPEMVEDALELISQDGDYMERIGMDVRVQCVICEWAGPKFILEYHLKQEHPQDIQQQQTGEWSVVVTLGALTSRQTWCTQLLQHSDALYAVSAKYAEDCVLLALSAIPTELETPRHGRITVYNKRTGKPFTHEGEIKHIPDSMPYEYGLECLVLDVASLDLIPNSANLKLVNRELVGNPAKVIVGHTELNNVEIIAYVKLLD